MYNGLPKLDEFIKNNYDRPSNSYVKFDGFEFLYVRISYHNIDSELTRTLDLANIKASHPGSGAFSNLVDWIFTNYPDIVIYVENVLNPRFGNKLIRMGFNVIPGIQPMCYYKRKGV